MTREELSRNDGRDGRPAWVAVSGKVYDLSASPRWPQGCHESLHRAGTDLTAELEKAPHVRAVMERFPVVGRLEEPTAPPARPVFPWLLVLAGGLLVLAAAAWLVL